MISELQFASSYTSFWRTVAPNSEGLIRRLNLGVERFHPPIIGSSSPERHAFLNELSFRVFANTHPATADDIETVITDSISETRTRLQGFDGVFSDILEPPSFTEMKEVKALSHSLRRSVQLIAASSDRVVVCPSFRGHGILNACEGDILVGDVLIEVKAGERSFRSIDLRQLITYCSLNFAEKKYEVSRIGCVNPRRGTFFVLDLNTISFQISSKPATELLAEVLYFLSTEGASG